MTTGPLSPAGGDPGEGVAGPGWTDAAGRWATHELGSRLDDLLVETQATGRAPSVSAAVSLAGTVVWSRAVGLSEVGEARAAEPAQQYRIGSITKLFTAVAVLQLREEGSLSLDDDLGRHLPGLPEPVGALRIRDLLAHVSGVQREPPGGIWTTHRVPERSELYAALAGAEVVGAAQMHWHYSNLGFGLLGEMVAQVRGRPFRDVVSELVLAPLGLSRTTWSPSPPWARGYDVHPYSDHVRPAATMELGALSALGQLWSTVEDLGRWGCFLAGSPGLPEVVSKVTREEMHEARAVLDADWETASGLGPKLFRHGGRILAGHAGGMPGFVAMLVYDRDSGVAAAALANTSTGPSLRSLTLELCSLVGQAASRPRPWRPTVPPPRHLAGLLGRWWCGGEPVEIRWRRKVLELLDPSEPGAGAVRLVAGGGDDLRACSGAQRGEKLELERGPDGGVIAFRLATYRYQRHPVEEEAWGRGDGSESPGVRAGWN